MNNINGSKNFQLLPSNLISFIYQYLPFKELLNISLSCKKMHKAFLNDFIWEEFVKLQEFFLPGEGENFSSWKNYFTYLSKLKSNIKVTSNKKGYTMIPYRGHKAIITAINYILLNNELSKIIVSGDKNGIINTWKIDEDGDYEPDTIIDTKSEIIDIKIYNDKMILWNKESNFYIFQIDLNSQKKNNNSQRFNLIYKYNITIENIDIKYIDWINDEDSIICSVDLNNKNYLKDGGMIVYYNFSADKKQTFHLSNDFDQLNEIRNLNLNDIPDEFTINKHGEHKNFICDGDLIIVFSNFDFTKYHLLNRYTKNNFGKKKKLDNLFIFNRKTISKIGYNINYEYIYNIIKLENGNFGILGFLKGDLSYRKYSLQNELLKTNQTFNIHINNIPQKVHLLYYDEKIISILINESKLINRELNSTPAKIYRLENKGGNINCIEGDKFRIIIANESNTLGIYNRNDASLWYYLLGGSMTVIPKSFIKNPSYNGFNIIKVTRTSIIGVMGNLIREYSFKPSIE